MIRNWLQQYVRTHVEMVQALDVAGVEKIVAVLAEALRSGHGVFVCGNGGSAASASHLSVDLGKGASLGRGKRFRVHSLNENTAWITALGNDVGYENIFAEQLANLASSGDVLLAMSVSGNSPNIIKAVQYANDHGLTTIGLCSSSGGKLAQMAQVVLLAPSDHFGHCEDMHMFICHLIGYAFIENKA